MDCESFDRKYKKNNNCVLRVLSAQHCPLPRTHSLTAGRVVTYATYHYYLVNIIVSSCRRSMCARLSISLIAVNSFCCHSSVENYRTMAGCVAGNVRRVSYQPLCERAYIAQSKIMWLCVCVCGEGGANGWRQNGTKQKKLTKKRETAAHTAGNKQYAF